MRITYQCSVVGVVHDKLAEGEHLNTINFNSRNRTFYEIKQERTSENCEHIESLRCFAFVWVIWPELKSKTSSLSNFRMTMLFWHKDSLVFDAPMMSGMKLSQFFGHSLTVTQGWKARKSWGQVKWGTMKTGRRVENELKWGDFHLFRIDTRMRLSLLRYVLSFSIKSGLELVLMIKPTMYLSRWL